MAAHSIYREFESQLKYRRCSLENNTTPGIILYLVCTGSEHSYSINKPPLSYDNTCFILFQIFMNMLCSIKYALKQNKKTTELNRMKIRCSKQCFNYCNTMYISLNIFFSDSLRMSTNSTLSFTTMEITVTAYICPLKITVTAYVCPLTVHDNLQLWTLL